jgi:polar amino acid transport system substrate-binding protein
MRLTRLWFLATVMAVTGAGVALAAAGTAPAPSHRAVFVPSFFDPHRVPGKPDLSQLHTIRFVTEDDYPPFHFALPDGSLAGFDVDLARAICEELKVACTIQVRRFDLFAGALASNQADGLLAALKIDTESRKQYDFTAPYYATPARFVTRVGSELVATPEGLSGKRVGVIAKTAHEAYLKAFFPKISRKTFNDRAALRAALRKGEIDALFDDAISSSFWILGTDSQKCCAFRGGPYTESRFFGEGVGIAVKKGNHQLRDALDYALAVLSANGVYTDLYLKYFPIGFY